MTCHRVFYTSATGTAHIWLNSTDVALQTIILSSHVSHYWVWTFMTPTPLHGHRSKRGIGSPDRIQERREKQEEDADSFGSSLEITDAHASGRGQNGMYVEKVRVWDPLLLQHDAAPADKESVLFRTRHGTAVVGVKLARDAVEKLTARCWVVHPRNGATLVVVSQEPADVLSASVVSWKNGLETRAALQKRCQALQVQDGLVACRDSRVAEPKADLHAGDKRRRQRAHWRMGLARALEKEVLSVKRRRQQHLGKGTSKSLPVGGCRGGAQSIPQITNPSETSGGE
jgi:hypothetical protein